MQEYYELKTNKGIMRGYIHKPNQDAYPLCMIFHGFTGLHTGTKFSYTKISRILEKQGIATIRLDFLGTGDSDLEFRDMTFKDELDCAVELLKQVKSMNSVSSIYVLGHSMGGAIASELAKLYPECIDKMCLWAPAFNLPYALNYLKGDVDVAEYYDHSGFEISDEFVEDMISRDFYKDLDIYKNDLMIIHGTSDMTVPYSISEKYLKLFNNPIFYSIEHASHNYDTLEHINRVIERTCQFFTDTL